MGDYSYYVDTMPLAAALCSAMGQNLALLMQAEDEIDLV